MSNSNLGREAACVHILSRVTLSLSLHSNSRKHHLLVLGTQVIFSRGALILYALQLLTSEVLPTHDIAISLNTYLHNNNTKDA